MAMLNFCFTQLKYETGCETWSPASNSRSLCAHRIINQPTLYTFSLGIISQYLLLWHKLFVQTRVYSKLANELHTKVIFLGQRVVQVTSSPSTQNSEFRSLSLNGLEFSPRSDFQSLSPFSKMTHTGRG